MKFKEIFIVFIFIFLGLSEVFADERKKQLDKLFNELNSPLLLLWGSKDPWMNTPKKRNLYKKFTPENTTEIILDAGHCPHDEIPESVNKHILDWMKSL